MLNGKVNLTTKATSTQGLEGQGNLVESLIVATKDPKEKAYISLLGRTGVRVSEANQLEENHIDFKRGTLTIVHLKERSRLKCPNCGETLGRRHLFCPGCGNKVEQAVREKVEQRRQRIIPVDSTTLALLKAYLEWRYRFPYRGPLVFPFSRQRGWQIVEKLGRRIGIRGLHPHSLRHLLATTWVNKRLDIRKLQLMLGHANISTTMEYVDSSFEQLRAEYTKLWQTGNDETVQTKG